MLPAGSIVGALYHNRPKQVELIEIINKPLLLHLVSYLYYWQMGFNSVFKGLIYEARKMEKLTPNAHILD